MAIRITRRDFLNGMAIGAGASLLTPTQLLGQIAPSDTNPAAASTYYPPTLTGMRGSHEGSFEVAHALAWRGEKPKHYRTLGEHYDLVIVGAGLSGLAAAWFYQKKMGADTRILLLDNHDDFGGHAKRNEFHHEGRMVLGLGGAQNIENPSTYSEAAASLLADIGINQEFLDAMDANTPDNFFLGGKFDADNGMTVPGPDGHVTVTGNWFKLMLGSDDSEAAVRALPIPDGEKEKLITFFSGERDFLDELSLLEKYDYVNSVSYNQFLIERVNLAEETVPILNSWLQILIGLPGWNLTVLEAVTSGAPGLRALGWLGNIANSLSVSLVDNSEVRMFPDGNASIARLLVQHLIPDVAPEMKSIGDIAKAQFNYGALDRENQENRLRLNSTVVGVREIENNRVEVDYVQQDKALRVTADHCILACYNGLIPHLCPEMSETQKEGLLYGVKVPFVYANVLLQNGRAFSKLGVTISQCPYDPFQWVSAAPTMTTGGYQPPRGPEDPMAVFMMSSPIPVKQKNATGRDLLRLGRLKIYSTPFASYEQEIRQQLQAMLGKHGFNHENDIRAITVNRISHGYAYAYLALDDPEWPEGQAPHEIGRAQFGRISIANSDSEVSAYMQAAWDAAWRAVEEQTP
jgi:spermidine dehydrogenase